MLEIKETTKTNRYEVYYTITGGTRTRGDTRGYCGMAVEGCATTTGGSGKPPTNDGAAERHTPKTVRQKGKHQSQPNQANTTTNPQYKSQENNPPKLDSGARGNREPQHQMPKAESGGAGGHMTDKKKTEIAATSRW